MHLGDSDIIRLSLVPNREGYQVEAEFPEHQVQTQEVPIERPPGYTLLAIARLDGVAFEIAPAREVEQILPAGKTVSWRWTLTPRLSGRQRLSLALYLRWQSPTGNSAREEQVYSKGITIQVRAVLGLSRSQATTSGFFSLVLGGSLGLVALVYRPRPARAALRILPPNDKLRIEPHPEIHLQPAEATLLRALFRRYARLILESEFFSGYSGARTLLGVPVLQDGRADAHTIVKIGRKPAIQREYENYEAYVKDSLPPITGRIQQPPVTVKSGKKAREPNEGLAALQYTFIAEPSRQPISLRQALLANPDPALLNKLYETFSPNWWMQRQPYVFRLAQEYDILLPPHYVLEPVKERGRAMVSLNETAALADLPLKPGDLVQVGHFTNQELRADGQSLSLLGQPIPGQPALRLRWLSLKPPDHTPARVLATRRMLLEGLVQGFPRLGLPDPLENLEKTLNENIVGSRSIIHGDLNLENILVGPGNFVWLIDFAQTRQGHPLFDFARLEVELIAHVLAIQVTTQQGYLELLRAGHPLLQTVEEIAKRCLANPLQRREYDLAFYTACLGALKFSNLESFPRSMLYLTAAHLSTRLF